MAHTVVAEFSYVEELSLHVRKRHGSLRKVQLLPWSSERDSNQDHSRPKASTTMKNMTSASALAGVAKDAEDRAREI